jgi:hypothetical protein
LFSTLTLFFVQPLSAAPIKATIDPTEMGIGARPLAMGKAFTSAADDCNSIFLNPSGLSFVRDWQMTSMYANVLGEINYNLVAFTRAFSREAVGIGLIRADVGDSQIISYRDPNTGRIVPTGEGAIGYISSVAILSYGGCLGRFWSWGALDDIYIGASMKIFNQELKGGTIEALASGMDMDLGLQYRPNSWLGFGVFGQNVLPHSAGGALRWTSGIEESIPSLLKVGVGAKLIGPNSPWRMYDNELFLNLDFEMSMRDRPGLAHVGLEWWPLNYFAFRAGIDQDAVSTGSGIGIDNNLAAGIGLYYGGFEFDYAYHQFGELQDNSTHYFSITLGVQREIAKEVVVEKPKAPTPVVKDKYINLLFPGKEAIVFGDALLITGEVEPEVATISVSGFLAKPVNGKINLSVPIEAAGKSSVNFVALNEVGRVLQEERIKVLRLPAFSDVPDNYWARNAISLIAHIGLVRGYPDGTFKPDGVINRAELTTMLVRATGEKLPLVTEKKVFADVPQAHWAAKYIKAGVVGGLAKGYPDGTFKPGKNINRAEGTVLVSRFAGIAEPDAIYKKPFSDLPMTHWAIKIISATKDAGILEYLEGRDFEAKRNLTRAEAVEMLSKTEFAEKKIADLLDFGKGY